MRIENIDNRKICIFGIGKMFYQEGFPIGMAIRELNKQNIECSVFHIADECLKNGWSSKTTYTKLREELVDSSISFDVLKLEKFCFSEYEEQRQMIFEYLFQNEENAKIWFYENTLGS